METLLEVRNLVKHFGSVKAVNDISFSIPKGQCLGLLGPNGAGKTTTIEIMEGILPATSGEVLYKGKIQDQRFRQEAGIQFQATALQEFLTVKETLSMFHQLYDKTLSFEELIETCSLSDILDRDTRKLSGGQRQRLLLALALVNNPDIVFLDEPTTGLDPQSRRNFWDLIDAIKSKGKTIVLTTHYMDEAYTLCDDILIVDQGKIIAQGTPQHLLASHYDESIVRLPTENIEQLSQTDIPFSHKNGWLEIKTKNLEETISALQSNKVSIAQMEVRKWNLEDLFIELTGKDLRS